MFKTEQTLFCRGHRLKEWGSNLAAHPDVRERLPTGLAYVKLCSKQVAFESGELYDE
jgi:hypothetical protein